MGALLSVGSTVAQTPGQSARLTVRPREMATGTQNPKAGEYPLDSVPHYLVSVPPQCAGARRCPLFIFLPGAGYGARVVTDWLRPVADKYGMLLLAPSQDPALPISPFGPSPSFTEALNLKNLDAALRQVLRNFAVEPDKIAIIGRCASGGDGMRLGTTNLDVFSRIASISGRTPTAGMDPRNTTAEFFLDAGVLESSDRPHDIFKAARALRRDKHPLKLVIGFRGHEHQVEDYDFLGRWLQESWTKATAARTAPSVVADPVPALTTAALTQLTAFWTRFMQEPDSIRTAARRAHLREVVVPVGEERPSVWMTNMAALATQYPSVAAALKAAGLHTQQHDAYRIALLGARTAKSLGNEAGTIEATSVLAKNLAFMDAHPDELAALEATGMWRTP